MKKLLLLIWLMMVALVVSAQPIPIKISSLPTTNIIHNTDLMIIDSDVGGGFFGTRSVTILVLQTNLYTSLSTNFSIRLADGSFALTTNATGQYGVATNAIFNVPDGATIAIQGSGQLLVHDAMSRINMGSGAAIINGGTDTWNASVLDNYNKLAKRGDITNVIQNLPPTVFIGSTATNVSPIITPISVITGGSSLGDRTNGTASTLADQRILMIQMLDNREPAGIFFAFTTNNAGVGTNTIANVKDALAMFVGMAGDAIGKTNGSIPGTAQESYGITFMNPGFGYLIGGVYNAQLLNGSSETNNNHPWLMFSGATNFGSSPILVRFPVIRNNVVADSDPNWADALLVNEHTGNVQVPNGEFQVTSNASSLRWVPAGFDGVNKGPYIDFAAGSSGGITWRVKSVGSGGGEPGNAGNLVFIDLTHGTGPLTIKGDGTQEVDVTGAIESGYGISANKGFGFNPGSGNIYAQNNLIADGTIIGNISSTTNLVVSVTGTSTSYAVLATDSVILLTGLTETATLPTAVGRRGKSYIFKDTLASTSTVATTGGQTIDGSATYSLTGLNKYVSVISDGANWFIIANN